MPLPFHETLAALICEKQMEGGGGNGITKRENKIMNTLHAC